MNKKFEKYYMHSNIKIFISINRKLKNIYDAYQNVLNSLGTMGMTLVLSKFNANDKNFCIQGT